MVRFRSGSRRGPVFKIAMFGLFSMREPKGSGFKIAVFVFVFEVGAEGVRFSRSPCLVRFQRGSRRGSVFKIAVFGPFFFSVFK